ncbi:uncharacterized protein SPSK_09754 [Sporothrix schenckii 1099-18]|uniref:Uncharacterized protein n=1 Tax=Sporothrix schenckii 1099-18 TaxID=1397361 RepID=A0A0F2M7Y0_SPOSC|nr:uncharacterized protein SPSK_09754 [Sporothrix schenckii 1099-18]KJR85798.1 hypothetical protein SPSK_09754 [Sporothrix schenckii 1099-18]
MASNTLAEEAISSDTTEPGESPLITTVGHFADVKNVVNTIQPVATGPCEGYTPKTNEDPTTEICDRNSDADTSTSTNIVANTVSVPGTNTHTVAETASDPNPGTDPNQTIAALLEIATRHYRYALQRDQRIRSSPTPSRHAGAGVNNSHTTNSRRRSPKSQYVDGTPHTFEIPTAARTAAGTAPRPGATALPRPDPPSAAVATWHSPATGQAGRAAQGQPRD